MSRLTIMNYQNQLIEFYICILLLRALKFCIIFANYVSKWLSNGIYEWRDKYAVAKGERRSADTHDVLTGFLNVYH